MLGKADEIKTKIVYPRIQDNPDWNHSKPTSSPRYLVMGLDEVVNETLKELGNVDIIQIQFQTSAFNGETAETALIIYKSKGA